VPQPSPPADPTVPLVWGPRRAPLTPTGQLALGPVSRALGQRLLGADDEALARLRGVSASGLLIVLGALEDLPWVDGVIYLGRDPGAPALLLPTNLEPKAPLPLVEAALLRRLGRGSPPVAVLPDPALVVGTGSALPIARSSLAAWLDAEG